MTALPLGAMAQQNYTVVGKVKHIHYPAKAYVWYQEHGVLRSDSGIVEHDQFIIQGKVSEPMKAYVLLFQNGASPKDRPGPDQVGVYLENGTVTVISPDSLQHARVGGTALNKDQQEMMDLLQPFKQQEAAVNAAYLKAEGNDALQVKLKDDYTALLAKKEKAQIAFVKTHPGSVVSLNLIRSSFTPATDPPKSRMLIGMLSQDLQDSGPAQRFLAATKKAREVNVGSPAPEFSMKNTKDEMISLSSYKGKYVLLDFWASWCVPCRKENPNVVKAYNTFKDKNFTVVGISLDGGASDSREKWLAAIEKDGLPYEQLSDLQGAGNAAAGMYLVSSIPSNFLIDPSGKIIAKDLRGEDLIKKLEEVLPKS
ncbi:AhpC/TSA family protein [Chitinophaga costaii]|nr:AhpC/TSA family protein [Chitinophaga costaii]